MSGTEAPWQLQCEKVEERCGYLLTSGLWSDCTFMVGSETNQEVIQAHKLVLAMASPVFEAMFYGGLSESNEPIVPIPDVTPESFRALLQYIYTGNINIDTFDMACDLWLGADKYMLPHLVTECKKYINSVLGPRNACRIYELARFFHDKTIMDKCIEIISTNTKEVLNDSSFDDVELNTLITVCSLDHLNVNSELDLFNAVTRYAEAEQRRQEQISAHADDGPPSRELSDKMMLLPSSSHASPVAEIDSKLSTEVVTAEPTVDKDNLTEDEPTIHTALQKIRFLTMSAQEFAAGPARSCLLTKDESYAVLMNILSTDSPVAMPTGFSECRERRQTFSYTYLKNHYLEAGSLDDTIHALQCGIPSQVTKAAEAASEIMSTHDIQPALDKGILDALVPALTEGDDECNYYAALAIIYFCDRGTPSQLSELAVSGALRPYCRLLAGGGWPDTDYQVLLGLTELLKKVDQNTKQDLILKLKAFLVPYLLTQKRKIGSCANDFLRTYFDNERW